MITAQLKKKYYKALLEKNSEFEGLFFVGVKTTGVFCRPTCPARKPKFENCDFFKTAQEALLASFRPCKRCKPLSDPQQVSSAVQALVAAIEDEPLRRWKNSDFKKLSIDSSTARRQFKKKFGMTFLEYARARRLGSALKEIRQGESIINTQLSSGYESGSGFRDAFSKVMGLAPSKSESLKILNAKWIDTVLGSMIAIGDETGLYLLEFVDRRGLEKEIEKLRKKLSAIIIPGTLKVFDSIKKELKLYFEGKLKEFTTPIHLIGSPFQKQVWLMLKKIPIGETISYLELATKIGNRNSFRAVARANGANQLALIIPCHRVINNNGDLGGYGGGLSRKKWLIENEKKEVI